MLKKMLSTLHAPEPAIPRLTTAFPSLHEQAVAAAETSVKIRLSILGTAMVDALGGPAEFKSRFSFKLVTSMVPNDNFALGSGVWTDDTSMTLCLARSLATFQSSPSSPKGGFDPKDQLDAYLRWFGEGSLSAVGRCFDIGNTISRALSIYERRIQEDGIEKSLRAIEFSLDGRECSGNGSLMRVLPIGLAYWRHEDQARAFARQSSVTTHPNTLCQEACEVWTGAITRVLQASSPGSDIPQLTKLDILDYFVKFPYQDKALRGALSVAADVGDVPASAEERETFYREHHPILHLIDTQQSKATSANDWIKIIPSQKELPSTGYVLHTLVAALYSFLATKTFEEGAILAVNLGSDADTVGAIYGGLASCWYAGSEEVKTSDLFWSQTVREWRKALVRRNIVEEVAEELVKAQKNFM